MLDVWGDGNDTNSKKTQKFKKFLNDKPMVKAVVVPD
jgi:nucleolar protein 53